MEFSLENLRIVTNPNSDPGEVYFAFIVEKSNMALKEVAVIC